PGPRRPSAVRGAGQPSAPAVCGGVVFEILALRGNAVSDVLGVVPDAPDEAGPPARLPRQAEEIDAGFDRYAALVFRPAFLVEGADLEPAVVDRVARCPDDRGDAGFR